MNRTIIAIEQKQQTDAEIERAFDTKITDAYRNRLHALSVDEQPHQRLRKTDNDYRNEQTEHKSAQNGIFHPPADSFFFSRAIILRHIGRKCVTEILYRRIGERIDFHRRRKRRHHDRAKTVHESLHEQNTEIHDRLLETGQ